MKKSAFGCIAFAVVLIAFLALSGAVYTVHETEQVVVTQFGEPKGEPITEPGLKFKIPFIQKINRFEKRILEWDGPSSAMPTKEKTFIEVDTYARWKIDDALMFLRTLTDERRALSRLDDILGSETRNSIAKHKLIEVIRSTRDRKITVEDDQTDTAIPVGQLIPIQRGRIELEQDILKTSKAKLKEFGIDLLDIRFKRINYNESVREDIYERMISERQQIAERFRSEGQGEAAEILGDMERELKTIKSAAYKTVETMKGEADAKATEIYAKAYNVSPESAEFYQFLRTMELYEEMLAGESTVILSTDSDVFKYLKRVKPLELPDIKSIVQPTPAKPKPKVEKPIQVVKPK